MSKQDGENFMMLFQASHQTGVDWRSTLEAIEANITASFAVIAGDRQGTR